jgi:hypothetical protein
MAINFPTSPTLNQEYSASGRTWKWNGKAWQVVSAAYGPVGPTGPANTLTIGTVTALSSGTATATITGTAPNQVLNLGLPKGDDGVIGVDGIDGTDGKSAYQSAVDNGFTGTEAQWVDYLQNTVAGVRITVNATAPSSPNVGDLWFW